MRRPFEGFDSAALAQFSRLPNWTKDDYAEHRGQLRAGLIDPAISLVVEVADDLSAEIGAELTVNPKIGGSVSPLNRDLRFAADKSELYKDHLLLTAWQGPDKKSSPVLWIRLSHDTVGFASGIGFDKPRRERWRAAVADDDKGAALVDAIEPLRSQPDFDLAGQELKRVPSPYPADHPRADLLRYSSFQVRWAEPLPPTATLGRFRGFCVERLRRLIPVHQWLVSELT